MIPAARAAPPVPRAPGTAKGRCYTPAVPGPDQRPCGAAPSMNRNALTVAVVGATGVVGRTMIAVLNERALPGRGAAPARLRALGRPDGLGRRPHARDRRGRARRLRRRRHRAVLGRRRHLARARPRGRRPRRDGHRQLVGLADGPDDPARRVAGQPRRPRGPPGHHRQPELLDDAARAGAHGAARQRRPRAGRRRHLPVGLGHRRGRHRRAGGQVRAHVAGEPRSRRGLPAPDRLQRAARDRRLPPQRLHQGGVEGRHREPQDPAPAGPADLVHGGPHPGLRQPFGGGPRRDARADHARSGPASCSRPCRASSSRTTRRTHDYPLATEAAGRDEIFVGPGPPRPVDRRRPRPRLLGRLRQPAQGRGDQRRRDRRDPASSATGSSTRRHEAPARTGRSSRRGSPRRAA